MTIKHQIRGKKQVQKVTDKALDNSNIWLSKTRNYTERNLMEVLFKTAIDKSSLESTVNKLQIKAEGYGSIPSADTILKTINREYQELSIDEIESKFSKNLQMVSQSMIKSSRSKVDIAIDIHNEEFYGVSMKNHIGLKNEFIMYNETGSRKVFKYATLTVVSYGHKYTKPITIGFVLVWKGMKRVDVVKRLLKQVETLDLKIDFLLMDGGFSGIENIKYLKEINMNFITRGKLSKKKNYFDSVGLSFDYELKNAKSSVQVEGLLLREKTKKGKRKFIFFLCSKIITGAKLKKLYRQRFRIENTYRHQRVVKIRTSSKKLHVRWFLWIISVLLELLWEISAHIYDILDLDKYSSRQELINSHIVDYIHDNLAPAKYRIN